MEEENLEFTPAMEEELSNGKGDDSLEMMNVKKEDK